MNRITRYINTLADKLDVDSRLAREAGHKPTIGDNRERLVQMFLSKHLPDTLSSEVGGLIIDAFGNESKQIDVIVSNNLGINFREHEKMFIGVEGVTSAITVKSTLDKAAIYDCLHNLASIPRLDSQVLTFKHLVNDPFTAFDKRHPTLFIFAYDGLSLNTCKEHVETFYDEFPSIPLNRRPCGIIVNKKYCIEYSHSEKNLFSGEKIAPYTLYGYELDEDRRGYGLCLFLNEMANYIDWLPHMRIGNDIYFNKAFE
jgi:hypothetical protein